MFFFARARLGAVTLRNPRRAAVLIFWNGLFARSVAWSGLFNLGGLSRQSG